MSLVIILDNVVRRSTKFMYYNALDSRVIRDRVDLVATFEEWQRVRNLSQDEFSGNMSYEFRAGREYLYRRTTKNGIRSTRSLGPRSDKTDAILAHYLRQKQEAEERLASLAGKINQLAAVMRALNHQRVPSIAARLIRKLDESPAAARFRVVGTHALYAYEAAAAVIFNGEMVATGDLDVLIDDRAPLRIAIDGEARGLEAIARSVDPSFQQRQRGDFRLTNKDGFMVEFIRPEARPAHRVMPGQNSGIEGDAVPAPIVGLEWLVSAPAFTGIAIDDRGFPVRMTAPAPAIWAAHKLWISQRADRDPGKAARDKIQAEAVLNLIEDRLPQERLDPVRHSALPKFVADLVTAGPAKPDQKKLTPDWE
ncbi:hypothetical protein GL286_17055 [Paracoccus aestuariivivens]|uniref:Nucleotidyltransferase-like domain-containing protein n=2 Tax=Paracoccus aestuariivivens TaxID=1820333 RepID=A0A6L6JE12_9RHOB|nr:hypothetical protein [Paracoccus aestuariivivens]